MSVLALNKVSYHYSNTTKKVLKDINMDFQAGKAYAIMGKSGARNIGVIFQSYNLLINATALENFELTFSKHWLCYTKPIKFVQCMGR